MFRSVASKREVEVTWQVRHEYRVMEQRVLLLYNARGDWNSMVQSVSDERTTYVFAASPSLNESARTYTFRLDSIHCYAWEVIAILCNCRSPAVYLLVPLSQCICRCRWDTLMEAFMEPEPDSRVLDSSGSLASSQASFADGQPSQSQWWRAQDSMPTKDGGFLVSPSFILGLGMETVFPSGAYMVSIQVFDEQGLSGMTAVGATNELCAQASDSVLAVHPSAP